MRKIYSLIAMFIMAIAANAQVISFSEAADKGTLDGKTFENGGLVLTVTDTDGKCAVDANSQYFGTAEEYVNYGYRFKTGGKSSSKNALTLTVPTAGTLKVYARSASSSDATRNLVFTENGTELLNQTFNDADAIDATIGEETKKVFPVYTCSVTAGTVDITYPVNGINIYAIELVAPAADPYTANITSDPEEIYYSGYFDFDMNQVASDLGLADKNALYDFVNAGGNVYIKNADGTLSNAYTGNTNEFWMDTTGAAVSYGETAAWYAGIYYDPAGSDDEGNTWDEEFYTKVGQMPGYFKKVYTDTDMQVVLVLVNGDKQVEFTINLHVNAAPEPTLPDPETSFSKLEVVKTYDWPVEFVLGKSYEGKTVSTTLDGVYDILGATAADLDASASDYIYTQVVRCDSVEGEAVYSYEDEMQLPADAAGGAWFGLYKNYDEATATETVFADAPMTWGAGTNSIYCQSLTLSNDTLSMVTGQYPDNFTAAGTIAPIKLYLIVGSKAVCINVVPTFKEAEKVDPSAMKLVGETTVEISADIDNNYATKSFTVDMETICAALGCAATDLEDVYAYAQDGSISDNHTEGSGGFYYNDEGKIESWGSSAAFFVALSSLESGAYTIGQMSGHFTEITADSTVVGQLIFQYGQNYYVVNVKYTVKAPGEGPSEYTLQGTGLIKMQIVPSDTDWAYATTKTIDLNWVEELIGTQEFTLYTDKADDTGALAWSKSYTCTPAPGFWYGLTTYENEEGQAVVENAGWGSNSFGITYASGVVTFYQYPGQRSVGDSYLANIYLVNDENGKYIRMGIRVNYVEEETPEVEYTTVGTEKMTVNFDEMGDDVALDANALCNALGIEAEDLESVSVACPDSPDNYSTITTWDDDIYETTNGYLTADDAKMASSVKATLTDGRVALVMDDVAGNLASEEAAQYTVRVAFINSSNEVYMVEVALCNTAAYTAINSVAANAASAKAIYTVAGAKVNGLQKGINIVKMADGSVKKIMK